METELLILQDNTCTEAVTFQNGIPLSAKHKDMGIGTSSIKEIAKRYHGNVQYEWRNRIFYTSVLMQYEIQKKAH